jgi:hypothetical protein
MTECREGVAFLGGLAGHFVIDALLLPLFGWLGWSFHKHKHRGEDDKTKGA